MANGLVYSGQHTTVAVQCFSLELANSILSNPFFSKILKMQSVLLRWFRANESLKLQYLFL